MDPDDPNRAIRLLSRSVPSYEIPKTTPPTIDDADQNPAFAKLAGVVLDMKTLFDLHAEPVAPQAGAPGLCLPGMD